MTNPYLLNPIYNKHKVYVHNLSYFDGIFILPILSKLQDKSTKISVVRRDGSLINIKIKFDKSTIDIRDSFLTLPASLAKSFLVEDKSLFPYDFVNIDNLNFIGEVPDIKYFNNVNENEYDNYKSNFTTSWSLKDDTIKYCINDCKVLYDILVKFNELIFSKFKVNINNYPTLPSLAYGIFRTKFNSNKGYSIPIQVGDIYDFIKESYTGGALDVYIPSPKPGEKIYCYDVNSLYPFVMSKFDMPIGKPKYFKCLRTFDFIGYYKNLFNKKPFGFFRVEVTGYNIEHPILQVKVNTKNGVRTMSPT